MFLVSKPNDFVKFFEFGEIKLLDNDGQNVALFMKMPFCVLQNIILQLTKIGIVDNTSISNPIAVWFPKLKPNQINSLIINKMENMHEEISKIIEKNLYDSLHLFSEISSILVNPIDAFPMLPIGIYVEITYRCKIQNIINILEETEKMVNSAGVSDFRFALATILAYLLKMENK